MPFRYQTLFQYVIAASLVSLASITAVWAAGETWSENGLIRISSRVPLTLAEAPGYFSGGKDTIPPNANLMVAFENRKNREPMVRRLSDGRLWIRIVILNHSPKSQPVVIRFPEHCRRLLFYARNGNDWEIHFTGHEYAVKEVPGSFYEAISLTLTPGINEFYLRNEMMFGTGNLQFIDFVQRDEIADDRAILLEHLENFIFFIIALLFIILFQLGYIVVQWHYHRKPEYGDYLFFLLLAGMYYLSRYIHIMRVEFFLYHLSEWINIISTILLIAPYPFYLRFVRHFVDMETRFPSKNARIKIVERGLFIMILIIASVSATYNYDLAWKITMTITALLFIYSFWLIIFFIRNHDKLFRFVLLGSFCALTGHLLAMTMTNFPELITWVGTPPLNISIAGLMLEMFFFNTGLGYKAKFEKDEKLKLQLEYYEQIEKTRQANDRLQTMRDHIASDLHDDVGSTLSSIALYSQLAARKLDKNNSEALTIIEKIQKSTRRMMESMNDIVWAIHSKHDSGAGLFERMRQFANEYLSLSETAFEMTVAPGIDQTLFTMEAKRNILLLFKEIIHNAGRHSGAGKVMCKIEVLNKSLIINIFDDGKGFNPAEVKTGHGLTGLETRSAELGGKVSVISGPAGTTISIVLPLDRIEA